MTHTPGPWTFDANELGGSYPIYPPDSYLTPWIAEAKGPHVGPNNLDEVLANARLIAAAPELLEALQGLTEIIGLTAIKHESQRDILQKSFEIARTAIAKATGTDP